MSIENVHYLNVFLGAGAIILQIFSVITLLMLCCRLQNKYLDFVHRYFLELGFALSLSAAVFSLVYSEIIKFLPCYLCWWQRVFVFPQVFLYGVALWIKDRKVALYSSALLIVALVISIHHNLGYYFGETSALPCDASGVSCYQHLVSEFGGYISIPMFSLTSIVALLVLASVSKFYQKEN